MRADELSGPSRSKMRIRALYTKLSKTKSKKLFIAAVTKLKALTAQTIFLKADRLESFCWLPIIFLL